MKYGSKISQVPPSDFIKFSWIFSCVVGILLYVYAYHDVFTYRPILFDDGSYLSNEKSSIFSLRYWTRLFSEPVVNLWHPLTVLSHDILSTALPKIGGIHHIANALLHLANAYLLFLFLGKIEANREISLSVCLTWLLHPVLVESVSWVSGRKDILCLFFCLICLLSSNYPKRRVLFFSAGILAMLSKPTAVVLPLIVILQSFCVSRKNLWDWKYLRSSVWNNLPLIFASIVVTALTLYFQLNGGQAIGDERTFYERLTSASWAILKSIKLWVYPQKLHVCYDNPAALSISYLLFLATLFPVLIYGIGSKRVPPLIRLGLGLFFFFLFPTLGLLRAGNSLVADRYLYISGIGLSIIIFYFLFKVPKIMFGATSLIVFLFSQLTWEQRQHWKTTETLFQRVVSIQPAHSEALAQLGDLEKRKGNTKAAKKLLNRSLQSYRENPIAHLHLGDFALREQRYQKAYEHFLIAVPMRQNEDWLHETLAKLAWNLGDKEAAKEHLKQAFLHASSPEKKQQLNQIKVDFEVTR